jgi:hypothetical protein
MTEPSEYAKRRYELLEACRIVEATDLTVVKKGAVDALLARTEAAEARVAQVTKALVNLRMAGKITPNDLRAAYGLEEPK